MGWFLANQGAVVNNNNNFRKITVANDFPELRKDFYVEDFSV